ncbi:Uncharacterized protein OBRU01_09668 [Operophtera brumata]|uniref:Malate dehydrogenase 1B n=1 Tax=Operophtera brumata TaxID=104452 RepID=A0A0L7LFK8_OPEBR|nr:Uncharacterized protein OBRU01_09668 [Operophtera brumata]
MVVRIVISGESQCEVFAEICLVADYLSQNLPKFCYERAWLSKINKKNKWHHTGSPLIWKEVLMKGSKPFYIGGASEFLEYCHAYYDFDSFLTSEKIKGICSNFSQYQKNVQEEKIYLQKTRTGEVETPARQDFVVCITGAGTPLAMLLISGLLEMAVGEKNIYKIYLYDQECKREFMEFVEKECSYIATDHPGKVVKYVNKIGAALTNTDLLIILDHIPFNMDDSIGDWLNGNKKKMANLALMINASALRKMYILFPNLGPACYNATILSNLANIKKSHIVVATSDLGLEVSAVAAEIAEVPLRNMFCPPVWGFVGINQLVDIRTTVHRYNSFEPYGRYTKVRNSSLIIGSITPEFRTMEYLMHFDESLWIKVAENKSQLSKEQARVNKSIAVLDVVKLWLFDRSPEHVVNLGIRCDGSFGLSFNGVFSQPSRFVDGVWIPASDYMLPKDPQMSLKYLEEMAELTMNLGKTELPKIVSFYPCSCRSKQGYIKKAVW